MWQAGYPVIEKAGYPVPYRTVLFFVKNFKKLTGYSVSSFEINRISGKIGSILKGTSFVFSCQSSEPEFRQNVASPAPPLGLEGSI